MLAARFDLSQGTRFDFAPPVRLGATPVQVHPDGYKVYSGVATFGDVVLDYSDLDPPRAEFRPVSEVLSDAALASMIGVPFTLQHPDDLLDETTVREHQHGTVISATRRGDEMVVLVSVPGLEAQQAIESGALRELSPGYRAKEDRTPGTHKGRRYDVVQRGHRYNHLAGVDLARARTPDGRVAKLDAASPAYPLASDRGFSMPPIDPSLPPTDLQDDLVADRSDAEPAPPAAEPAKADMLALSEDDMALIKQMSPEGQAMLMGLMSGEVGEAKAMEAAALAAGAAAGAVPPLEDAATPPAAPAAAAPAAAVLDAAAVAKMIDDAIAAIGKKPEEAPADAEDEPEEAPAAKKDHAINPAKVIADAAAASTRAFNDASSLVEAVRKDGHRVAGAESAATVALSTITTHAPRLAEAAKDALKTRRMDAFLAIYATAEDRRRDSLLDEQGAALVGAMQGEDGSAMPAPFLLPAHLVR